MKRSTEAGGVSLFIVIFTAIIITIITVGFTQFVIRNQQQTAQNDLSDRAYDSAMAGVEDAKRVLVAYTNACNAGTAECTRLAGVINAGGCDTIARAGIAATTVDTNTETTVGDPSDNQAYTCVKIQMQTSDYEGDVKANDSTVVHLRGAGNFSRIKISWFSKADADNAATVSVYQPPVPLQLPPASSWQAQYPPILQAQYIPASASLTSLDTDAKTAFLYPVRGGADTVFNLADDQRRAGGAKGFAPQPALCTATYSTVGGACSKTLQVPTATSDAYLQLGALYNDTSFIIELQDGSGNTVKFDGVAPSVDSTGRAADVFRRVDARVKVGGVSLPAPVMATQGSLCKTFTLDDAANGNPYSSGSCTP